MLILVSEGVTINPDYIVNLFLADHPLSKGDIVNDHRYSVVAKIIDGSSLQLMKTKDKEEAQKFYQSFISHVNKSNILSKFDPVTTIREFPQKLV